MMNSGDTYSRPPYVILILFSVGCLFLGFFLNFSFEQRLVALVQEQFKKNAPCPLKYDKPEILYFFPGLKLKNIKIPPRCLPDLSIPLNFDTLSIQVKSFNIFSLRPRISFAGEGRGIFIRGSLFAKDEDLEIQLNEVKVEAALVSDLLGGQLGRGALFKMPSMRGNLQIQTELKMGKEGIDHLLLEVLSKDLKVPSFKVLGIELPEIDVGPVAIMAQTIGDGKKIQLKKISLGGDERSITADLKGEITLNQQSFLDSKIKGNAKFKLAPKLLEDGPGVFLRGPLRKFYRESDQFYHVSMDNTLRNIQFKELSQKKK